MVWDLSLPCVVGGQVIGVRRLTHSDVGEGDVMIAGVYEVKVWRGHGDVGQVGRIRGPLDLEAGSRRNVF